MYVYEDTYNEVLDFAYDRWNKYQERATTGKPLFTSFPESLKRYLEEIMR